MGILSVAFKTQHYVAPVDFPVLPLRAFFLLHSWTGAILSTRWPWNVPALFIPTGLCIHWPLCLKLWLVNSHLCFAAQFR